MVYIFFVSVFACFFFLFFLIFSCPLNHHRYAILAFLHLRRDSSHMWPCECHIVLDVVNPIAYRRPIGATALYRFGCLTLAHLYKRQRNNTSLYRLELGCLASLWILIQSNVILFSHYIIFCKEGSISKCLLLSDFHKQIKKLVKSASCFCMFLASSRAWLSSGPRRILRSKMPSWCHGW